MGPLIEHEATGRGSSVGSSTEAASGKTRRMSGPLGVLATAVAVGMSVFHLWFSTVGSISTVGYRAGHLVFAMTLVFLLYPATKRSSRKAPSLFDWLLVAGAIVAGVYIIREYSALVFRTANNTDVLIGTMLILLTLEMTRRTVGLPLVVIAAAFLAYAFVGPYMPGVLAHRGYSFGRVVSLLYSSLEGIYGSTLGVMASTIFLFILFGAAVEKSPAGKFMIDLALAIAGRARSGPAMAAVVSSALVGSISGSGAANALTTGTFTIPLMKKLGYQPHIAAAIETAASSGGLIMPPVMGAGAFILSEWTGVPYLHVIKIAAIPALMYYLSVAAFVHLRAVKMNVGTIPSEELPKLREVLARGWQYIIPPVLLVVTLVLGYSVMYAAIVGLVSLLVATMFRKDDRLGLSGVVDILKTGANHAVEVSATCACAGIVVGIVALTGLGMKFSTIVVSFSHGSLFLALVLVALAATVLGMGLPVTVAYIMVAAIGGSVLTSLGLPLVVAHLTMFWLSCLGNITPPVCITAYAAAGVAGADPMKTGWYAFSLAKGLYILPFLFAYTPLLTGSLLAICVVALLGSLGLVGFTAATEGFLFRTTTLFERILLAVGSAGVLWPSWWPRLTGMALLAIAAAAQRDAVGSARAASRTAPGRR